MGVHQGPRPFGNTRGATNIPVLPSAIGGTVTEIQQNGQYYRVHTFTSVGTSTFTVTRGGEVEYLIVGGGGGSSGSTGGGTGGGGAGGLIVGNFLVSPQSYNVDVGAGGAGRTTNNDGGNGGDSSVFDLVALGGGGGAGHGGSDPAPSGGSGGGGADAQRARGTALQPNSSSGGFGNDGGPDNTNNYGSGGGGAGEPGGADEGDGETDNGLTAPTGRGGNGLQFNITGIFTFYAGGGSGGASMNHPNAVPGQPGLGGGGTGGAGGENPIEAVPNTGGGAGGGTNTADGNGRDGGSGIVIVRYRITKAEFEE